MIVKFAGGFIGSATTMEQRQNLLNVACTAWNIAVLPKPKHKKALAKYLQTVQQQNPHSVEGGFLRKDLKQLIKLKMQLFPESKKPIVHAEVWPNGDSFSISAVSMRTEHE